MQEGDNIIKVGQGIYASVNLSYNSARNTIKLVTSNGEQEEIQLNTVGSLIDGMEYDSTNRAIVIKYHDSEGNQLEFTFPVGELFNDWVVDNPSENSAIELTKTVISGDSADKLSARVLVSDHADNALIIDGNALYVSNSAMTDALEIAECVKNEVSVLERVVIGHKIDNECGSGYTYEPDNLAKYINTATSVHNATALLDRAVSNLSSYTETIEDKVDELSGETECIKGKSNAINDLIFGTYYTIPECGEGAIFPTNTGCIISAATSVYHAELLLDDALCEIKDKWFLVGSDTPSTHTEFVEDGQNRKAAVFVKLSYGINAFNASSMTDSDMVVSSLTDSYFTDTNVLKVVNIEKDLDGHPITPELNRYNGMYLSNIWDCGMYYDEVADAEAMAEARAEGYEVDDYITDTGSTASNYDYSNEARQ